MSLSRCVICGRMTEPKIVVGGHAIGPKCAKRLGLNYDNALRFRPMIQQKAAEFESLTPDLFGCVENDTIEKF